MHGDPLEQHQDWCLLHYSCSDTLVLEISVITNTNGKFSMDAKFFGYKFSAQHGIESGILISTKEHAE